MKIIKILAVGRLKTKHWQAAAAHYIKRISFTARVLEEEVKDADAKLPKNARMSQEAERLDRHIKPTDVIICLDETGKGLSSQQFARLLGTLYDQGKTPCFIIGGAFGIAPELSAKVTHKIALGPMTFPHELARVLLLEQLYRAETILLGTGYHH